MHNVGGISKFITPKELHRVRKTGEVALKQSSYIRLDDLQGLPLDLMLRVWGHLPRWWRYGVLCSVCSTWWLANMEDAALWKYLVVVQRRPFDTKSVGESAYAGNGTTIEQYAKAGALLLLPHEVTFVPNTAWVDTLVVSEPYLKMDGPWYEYFCDGDTDEYPYNLFRQGGVAAPSIEAVSSWPEWLNLSSLRLPVGPGEESNLQEDHLDYEKQENFELLVERYLEEVGSSLRYLELPGDEHSNPNPNPNPNANPNQETSTRCT